MSKTTSIRIPENYQEFLKEKFDSYTNGINVAIDVIVHASDLKIEPYEIIDNLQFLQQIRRVSLREIKGIFSENEWKFLADSLNGTIITPEFRCLQSGLIAEVEDSEHFDGTAIKWNVSVPDISEKINKLTGAQIDAVYLRIEQFWNDEKRDIETWANW